MRNVSWAKSRRFALQAKGLLRVDIRSRTFAVDPSYRYAFNGKEKDTSFSDGTSYDYGFRIYNPELGKFLSVDPLASDFAWYTPYQFAGNSPIENLDLDGLEQLNFRTHVALYGQGAPITYAWDWVTDKIIGGATRALHGVEREVKADLRHQSYLRGEGPSQEQYPAHIEEKMYKADKLQAKTEQGQGLTDVADGIATIASLPLEALEGMGAKMLVQQGTKSVVARSVTKESLEQVAVQKAPNWVSRHQSFAQFSYKWPKASLENALENFAKNVDPRISKDGVKTKYKNVETNIEVFVDNENGYFRIFDHNKKQWGGLDGNVPSTKGLLNKEARDEVKSKSHFIIK